MNRWMQLVAAAALTLTGASAFAQALTVRDATITRIDGRRTQLTVKLGKTGAGQEQGDVKVFWVSGANRREVYSGTGRFDGTAGGFSNAIEVEAGGDNGTFEVVVPTTSSRRAVQFAGAEASFENARIEQIVGGNPNRRVFLVLKNAGPGTASGCRVSGTLAENGAPRPFSYNVPNLPPRAKYEKAVPYNFRASNNAAHNKVTATVTCPSDPVPTNNAQNTTLR